MIHLLCYSCQWQTNQANNVDRHVKRRVNFFMSTVMRQHRARATTWRQTTILIHMA
jgi:hypothetical protein